MMLNFVHVFFVSLAATSDSSVSSDLAMDMSHDDDLVYAFDEWVSYLIIWK